MSFVGKEGVTICPLFTYALVFIGGVRSHVCGSGERGRCERNDGGVRL